MTDPQYTVSKKEKVFYRPSKWYSFTWNPAGYPSVKTVREWMRELLDIPDLDYVMHIEISEPRNNNQYAGVPRIHLHGCFRANTIKAMQKFLLQGPLAKPEGKHQTKRECKYEIDTIGSAQEWYDYCTKQSGVLIDYTEPAWRPLSNFVDYKDVWKQILKPLKE